MDATPRRASRWKVLGLIVAALVLSAAVLHFRVRSVAETKLASLDRRVRELREEDRARDPARPVLRGEALPGNAWDEYGPALREVGDWGRELTTLEAWAHRYKTGDRAAAEEVVQKHIALLDPIRRGVRHGSAQFPFDWDAGIGRIKGPVLKQTSSLVILGVCQARLLADGGRAREAAELLLDLGQFSHDVGFNGTVISLIVANSQYRAVTDELKELLLTARLPVDDLVEIARGLDLLDRSFPSTGAALLNELLVTGIHLQGPDIAQKDLPPGAAALALPAGWRYLFSWRLMLGKAWEEREGWTRRAVEATRGPWKEMKELVAEVERAAERSPNPIGKVVLEGVYFMIDRDVREVRAQLRLLRVAAQFRATGEAPDLDDPFGDRLRHSRAGDKLRAWSVGKDGADDGGSGGWKDHLGNDIVLEVER